MCVLEVGPHMLLIVHGVVCMNRLCCKVTQQYLTSMHAMLNRTDIPKTEMQWFMPARMVLIHNYNVVLRSKDHNIMYQIRQSQ